MNGFELLKILAGFTIVVVWLGAGYFLLLYLLLRGKKEVDNDNK